MRSAEQVPSSLQEVDAWTERRLRRREHQHFVVAGLLIVSCVALDVAYFHAVRPDLLLVRLAWGGLTAACGWGLGRAEGRRARALRVLAGALMPAGFFGLLVWLSGGASHPLLYFVTALPLAAIALTVDDLPATVVAALANTAMGVTLTLHAGWEPRTVVVHAGLVLSSGVLGVLSASYIGGLRAAQARGERRRLAAVQALADGQARASEAERLATVGRLAAGVAHEVNNPLAFVKANLAFIEEELRAPGAGAGPRQRDVQEALAETRAGVERIAQIVADLKRLARGDAEDDGAPAAACDLARSVEESLRLASVRLNATARVVREGPPALPAVRAEPRRLGQVLLNLLINAADALEEARVSGAEVRLRVEEAGERVRVVVEDNGPGLSAEALERLFTPFFTTKAPGKGTGLGLSLSRQYVETFGGRLLAENRPGGGARFTVELRRAA